MLTKISHIKLAINAGAYQAALALALTLPDICGQIQYPNEKSVGKRYVDWCDSNVNFSDGYIGFGTENAELKGAVCYALRCAFLHSGNDDILQQSAAAKSIHITSFSLVEPDGIDGYGYAYRVSDSSIETTIDMKYLCDLICDAAEKFYNAQPDKTVFNDHTCMVK